MLIRKIITVVTASIAIQAFSGVEGECRCIDLETAWQRVLYCSPYLSAVEAEVGVLAGETEQVSLMPNPVFEVEAENIGVSNPNDNTEPPQSTYSLSQIIELGGKRGARRALAASVTQAACLEAQIAREDLLLELKMAFIEAKIAQERLKISQERLCVADYYLEMTKRQIEGGKISPIQEKRAQIGLMAEKLAVKEARSTFSQAKKKISSMWGCSSPDFEEISHDLDASCALPSLSYVSDCFFETPDFHKAQQMLCSASKNLKLQKANSIPDVNVTVGYRMFHDSTEGGFLVGAEIPLPFFDRNQGNIRSAVKELSQAHYQVEEVIREAQEEIAVVYERLYAAFEEAEMIRTYVLVEASEAYALTEEGYREGKFAYSDLLEAQRVLYDIQEKYLDILYTYHINRAELCRLSGVNL